MGYLPMWCSVPESSHAATTRSRLTNLHVPMVQSNEGLCCGARVGLWHASEVLAGAAHLAGIGGATDAGLNAVDLLFLTLAGVPRCNAVMLSPLHA